MKLIDQGAVSKWIFEARFSYKLMDFVDIFSTKKNK